MWCFIIEVPIAKLFASGGVCVFITAGPITKLFACVCVCVFITAGPITKLFAWRERVNAPTLNNLVLTYAPLCQAQLALLIHRAEMGATTAVPEGRLQMRVVLQARV